MSAAAPATRAFDRVLDRLLGRPVALYGTAVLRIGYGCLYLVFLLHEFPHRREIWGPDAAWSPELARTLLNRVGWVSLLTRSDRPAYFEACYGAAVVVCALFVAGWHTRVLSVLFAVVVTSFYGRAIYVGDGGDNVLVIMSIYLVFTACGRRLSFDARRRRRASNERATGPAQGQAAMVRRALVTVVHNCAVLVIGAEVCFVYATAGLYKAQGVHWQDGTALYYVLHADYFRPWPGLSDALAAHALAGTVASYLTVLVQVGFPFLLANRRAKYAALVVLVGTHLGIAVLLGLPLFSAAMIVGDALFVPEEAYRALTRTVRRRPP